MIIFQDLLPQSSSYFPFQQPQLSQSGAALNRVDCICEHIRRRMKFQVIYHILIIDSDPKFSVDKKIYHPKFVDKHLEPPDIRMTFEKSFNP